MPAKTFKVRPKADADLEGIFDYTAQEWGLGKAEDYIRDIHQAFLTVAENNRIGRDRSHVRPSLRAYNVHSHVVFYKPTGYGAAIIRVLHKSMDYPARL